MQIDDACDAPTNAEDRRLALAPAASMLQGALAMLKRFG